MRIALAGFSHETNTFSNVPATYDRFTIDRGEEIVRRHTGAHSTVTGFLEVAAERGVELVPLLKAQTGPIGMISADAFDRIVDEMLGLIESEGPWDAVLLANHGAAVSEQYPDVEFGPRRSYRTARFAPGPLMGGLVAIDSHINLGRERVRRADRGERLRA